MRPAAICFDKSEFTGNGLVLLYFRLPAIHKRVLHHSIHCSFAFDVALLLEFVVLLLSMSLIDRHRHKVPLKSFCHFSETFGLNLRQQRNRLCGGCERSHYTHIERYGKFFHLSLRGIRRYADAICWTCVSMR
jgi:hypothetical protein